MPKIPVTKKRYSSSAGPGVLEYDAERKQKETDLGLNMWLDAFRLRIIAAAVHGYRCLITLESGAYNSDLNFCHLVARTTDRMLLRALEYAIGLYPSTLFLNSYLNLIILKVDLHHTYDNGRFLLLPQLSVLREILTYLQRNEAVLLTKDKEKFYQKFSRHVWTYEFLNVSYDPERSINRKRIDETKVIGGLNRFANADGYIECRYPFDQPVLSNLESHGHPLFMAFNAAFLLWEQSEEIFEHLYREQESIRLVHEIGVLLTRPPPAVFYQTKPGQPNAPSSTEKLDYLLPQEARYTEKLPLFKELLEEFQKARDGESDVLPGGVVSPSAKKRKQRSPSSRLTRSSKLSVRDFILAGHHEGRVVDDDNAIPTQVTSPCAPPSTANLTACRSPPRKRQLENDTNDVIPLTRTPKCPRIGNSNCKTRFSSIDSTVGCDTRVRKIRHKATRTEVPPNRSTPTHSLGQYPNLVSDENMASDTNTSKRTLRSSIRQTFSPSSSLENQSGVYELSEGEFDSHPVTTRKRAYENDEGEWGNKQQRKRLRREVRKKLAHWG
ncbi:hypothetical protein E1B28_010728 [Marasmius oreades]|uniref:HNH nuclease domain-containing protein n=1 Tax=Marasmius oreades TaxID=181124 RepID=A0A9P7UPH5_9AGAR|nr:uncharacterized protein E1B28_010728 [Marasmius oreades]KAG7089015.1 hypothetical protein E1B28_010728 [Marasmius oreades]